MKQMIVVVAVLALSACAEQVSWVETKAGMPHEVTLDPGVVERVSADAAANGYPGAGPLAGHALREAVHRPGLMRFATVIEEDSKALVYVGAKSVRTPDGPLDTDFLVKTSGRDSVHVHMMLAEKGDKWVLVPDSYNLSLEPPAPAKKSGDKKSGDKSAR